MSYFLNEEQVLMKNAVRDFAQGELKARAAEIDKTSDFPMDIWKRCAELGLTGIAISQEYGGLGESITTQQVMMEEIGKVSPAVGLMLNAHLFALALIEYSENEAMKKKYLPLGASGEQIFAISATDPAGASNMAEWTMFAAKQDDKWILNGNKVFCTNSHVAGTYVVMSLTQTGLSNFIVPAGTEGMETGFFEHKIGLHGVNSGSVTYKNVVVPADHELNYPMSPKTQIGIIDMSTLAMGAAETALEKTVSYMQTRTRSGKPLIARSAIAQKLIDIGFQIELARNTIFNVVKLVDEGRPMLHLHYAIKGNIPKMMISCIGQCIELHGAVGYSEDTGLSMLWRDALGCDIAEGAATTCMTQAAQYCGWPVED